KNTTSIWGWVVREKTFMRLNLDLDKLKVFYYVAKAKKFTTAAEILNISQPALSRSIQLLEDRLGIKLFYRHTRGLTLTAQGELLLPIVGKFLGELEAVSEKLYEEEKEPKGPLKVVAIGGLINFFLLPHIPGFLKLYPKIRLTFKVNDAVPLLELGEAHAVIRPLIHSLEAEGLIQDILLTNHIGLYASKEYLKEFGIPKKPADLDHHRLITYGDHMEAEPFKAMNWHLTLGTEPGYVREAFLQINSPHARFVMAQAGIGIIAISKEHPGLQESSLVQILPHISAPTIESYYIYPKELKNSKKIIALREYLREALDRDYGTKNQ
ncbi:MAG: LysR family transcriptional regulator, partial [Alphaproteobacteria bacterium]|nr:LysR family transcriptional regulator [Alphaproteobacteria bacterium]